MKDKKHLDIYGGLREDIGMKTYLHGPMEREKAETAISLQGTWTYQKEEIYQ